ncbi:hypothetical protein K9K77_02865, partial [Candidatus Babeliales bacterium]|nr:hypothetical protein [Candidatus Babeliales bacterium]
MIKKLLNIFIPQTYGEKALLPLKTLSITFEEQKVIGTVFIQKGSSYSLVKTLSQDIDITKNSKNVAQALALKELVLQVGSYDTLVTTISSSLVTFKELSLPFLDEEKIRMILPFEIEALLPFDTFHACIDFIVTKKHVEEKKSDIMVAAIQKKYIQELTDIFDQADLELSSITTNVIALYGIYARRKATNTGNTAFIELSQTESTIAFFVDGQLKYIRSLQEPFDAKTNNELFWKKIIFTLQSFKADTATGEELHKIILFGDLWKDSMAIAEEKLNAPCQHFNIERFCAEAEIFIEKNVSPSNISLIGFAIGLSLPAGQFFSLRLSQFTKKESSLFAAQIITGSILIFLILALAGGYTFYQIHTLSREKDHSEKEILNILKKNFPSMKKNSSLSSALDEAYREIKKEEEIWSSLSQQTRQSFLYYLSTLSVNVEREVLGLNLKKLSINKNVLTLEGSVRNFE